MHKRETQIMQESVEILKKYLNPSRIILFGSRAKGTKNKHTDFDIAVDCTRPKISIQRQINEAIDKISGLYKVDVVYMNSVDKEFKDIIVKTGRIIYERRA